VEARGGGYGTWVCSLDSRWIVIQRESHRRELRWVFKDEARAVRRFWQLLHPIPEAEQRVIGFRHPLAYAFVETQRIRNGG